MLTEEAHHLFVGESGVARVIQRSAELTKQAKNGEARALGGIDLPTIQKFINFWFSSCMDLFGSEISSNAATFFAAGLKGRAYEEKHYTDHSAMGLTYGLDVWDEKAAQLVRQDVPMRNAMNEVLRVDYVEDSKKGIERWNKILEREGLDFRFTVPSSRFNRRQGIYAGHHFDFQGAPVSAEAWEKLKTELLPSPEDWQFVKNLQARPITAPGQMANWIAPPPKGIDGKPTDYEYVRGEAA